MTEQATIGRKYPQRPRGAAAQQDLVKAYRDVFLTTGTAEQSQKEIVLADLANASGFYQTGTPTTGPEARAFADGKRSVFARILTHLRMPPELVMSLETAAQVEGMIDTSEQE